MEWLKKYRNYRPQKSPFAIDLTHTYQNFKQVDYEDRHGQNKQEFVSTVDHSAIISNNSQNIVVVLDVLYFRSELYT